MGKTLEAGQIDVEALLAFSVLHCSGKPADKTHALFNIIQEGGLEAHDQVSAGDKDFAPVFKKLCEFVTVDVFRLAKEAGAVQ